MKRIQICMNTVALLVFAAGTSAQVQRGGGEAPAQAGRAESSLPANNGAPSSRDSYTLVYDDETLLGSATDLNVAYTDPDSYTNPNGSSFVWIHPMASTTNPNDPRWFTAPDPGTGIPLDIIWDEFGADLNVWGAPGTLHTLNRIDFLPMVYNADGVERPNTLNIGVFNLDGDVMYGLAGSFWNIPADWDGWWDSWFDFTYWSVDFPIADTGWIMYDWADDMDGGVAMVIAGGDVSPNDYYPDASGLITMGDTDPLLWLLADPETNVDPNYDGEPGVSYLDVFNTGDLWDWAWWNPADLPEFELAHDFPFRLYADTGAAGCEGDLDGDGDVDQSDLGVLLAAFNLNGNGDLDGDGDTDQSDLGILLANFGCTPG